MALMLVDDRTRTLRVVYRALAPLDQLWEKAPVCDDTDVELNHVIAGPVLAAEHHLWDARFQLMELMEEEQEEP